MNTLINRLNFAGILFSVVGILLFAKIIQLQTNPKFIDFSEEITGLTATYEEIVYPERGDIYDRWGILLAGNKIVYEIGVDLRFVNNLETIITTMDSELQIGCRDYLNEKNRKYWELANVGKIDEAEKISYAILADFIDSEKAYTLQKMKDNYQAELDKGRKNRDGTLKPDLRGLVFKSRMMRIYPEGSVASNVIGYQQFFNRIDAKGLQGVEAFFDRELSGTPQRMIYPNSPNLAENIPSIDPGESLILTIDVEMQKHIENIMDAAVASTGSISGTAIIMDPKTGEILAMTTSKRIDINNYGDFQKKYEGDQTYNPAISTPYEPGSVFKIITMAAGLDSGAIKWDEVVNDPGVWSYGGWDFTNWDYIGHGLVDMTTCLAKSLNVCLVQVAIKTNAERFYDYLTRFGLDQRTNIDLANESFVPPLTPKDQDCNDIGGKCWTASNLAANSFGQAIQVTPIQLIKAISAVANDGKMVAPYVVKASINKGIQHNFSPISIQNPISKKTAQRLSDMLATALESEASKALVPGYRIAGKTGTASIPYKDRGGYRKDRTNATFVGWGPVDDPKFIVYIWLEEPETQEGWSSLVAAPVFADIVKYLVIHMSIPPDSIRLGKNK
jgi:cell division protein FtsI/penicillin-binding protein 2